MGQVVSTRPHPYGNAMPARTEVFRITDAQQGLTTDQAGRARKYMISMAIRTICFVGAVVATGWLRWALIAGAVLLPYAAVVIANAGREPTRGDDELQMVIHTPTQVALPSRSVDTTE